MFYSGIISTTAEKAAAIRAALDSYKGIHEPPAESRNGCQSALLLYNYRAVDIVVHACPRRTNVMVKGGLEEDVAKAFAHIRKLVHGLPKPKIVQTTDANYCRRIKGRHSYLKQNYPVDRACARTDVEPCELFDEPENPLKPDCEHRKAIIRKIQKKRSH
jgi:hypothetical protein